MLWLESTPRLRSSPPLALLVSPPARARSRARGCSWPWIAGPGSARRAALRAALGRRPAPSRSRSTAPPSRSLGLTGRGGVPSIGDRSPTSPAPPARPRPARWPGFRPPAPDGWHAHPAEASPCQGEPREARRGGRTSAPRGGRQRNGSIRGVPSATDAAPSEREKNHACAGCLCPASIGSRAVSSRRRKARGPGS